MERLRHLREMLGLFIGALREPWETFDCGCGKRHGKEAEDHGWYW